MRSNALMVKLIGRSRGKTREPAKKSHDRGKCSMKETMKKGKAKSMAKEIDGKKVAKSLFGHLVVRYPDLGNNSATMVPKKRGHTADSGR